MVGFDYRPVLEMIKGVGEKTDRDFSQHYPFDLIENPNNDIPELWDYDLSMLELHIYTSIYLNGTRPLSTEELAMKFYKGVSQYEENTIWVMISRIKKKLGNSEIIHFRNKGYLSRRALIEAMVTRNLERANSKTSSNS